jgi:enoyl-CoA hydratase/carnithine racemase
LASWNEINLQLAQIEHQTGDPAALDQLRNAYINNLANIRGRNVICYYSGWLHINQNAFQLSINDDDMNGLMNAVHGMDRSRGLDLVLHTPGGEIAAAEAIVKYLMGCFDNDVVAIVPQLAMSAGTMVACACKSIIMGRQSSLGPTDPQLNGVPAAGVIEEFNQAVEDAKIRPESIPMWSQIIGKYHPTFIGDCLKAVNASKGMVESWLRGNMFSGDADCDKKVGAIVDKLCEHHNSAMHNRHFSAQELIDAGMKIELLESDNALQDAVLSVHHAFMTTFQRSSAAKIIESSGDKHWIIQVAQIVANIQQPQ